MSPPLKVGSGLGIPSVPAIFQETGMGWWNESQTGGTLRERDYRDGVTNLVAYGVSENQRAEVRLTDYSRQITSGGDKPGQFGVRRLTPTECERLQGFPDGWTAVNGMSDSARYRMLGNAVAVPVAYWIGQRIIEVT